MAGSTLIFVSGGVRSGKSAWAEKKVLDAEAARSIYLASGRAYDAEMKARIERHRMDRLGRGWTTIEQPLHLEDALAKLQPGDAVLWDCVTTWLANELYEGWENGMPCAEQPGCMEKKWARLQETLIGIQEIAAVLVIVSNEVLDDFIRDRTYQFWLGKIHLWLVAQAKEAYEMENGFAYKRK
ncbi:bifunctional adenosylcobinamide kinase/adenosylcobinamide-phosphate guanylyltransferase [Planococcus chinensis]|uniref:Adenosylcobinamide kinase n=1 Tax=Planococcus chinensis TaxID=272917 RepID=A0ABW4QEA9_9BACL